jgi:DNA-binding transcriptional ArsR family regulator
VSPAVADLDELWAAIGAPTRRRVVAVHLDRGEATATAMAGELPVTRQAVAKHLAVLDRAGLVQARRQGREVRYAIRPQRLVAATRSMAQVAAEWDARLSAIKRIAEALAREQAQERQREERST